MRWDRFRIYCSALISTALIAGVAQAGFTPISPPFPGEQSHQQILSTVYGGTFVPVGDRDVDFSNGLLLAFRVDDFLENGPGGALDFGGPTGGVDDTDQTWQALFTGATAEARFAQFEQTFGFFPGETGGAFQQLFAVTGSGYGVTGEASVALIPGTILRWGRGGQDRILSSRIADNADGEDHMVTYQILPVNSTDGNEFAFRWLVFWEDILAEEPFEDWDFNDLVVEITAIPEPATAMGAIGMLGGLALKRRRS